MGAQKHVIPILLIIVIFVALLSTYAWFSMQSSLKAFGVISTGVPTSFALSDDQGDPTSNEYASFETYSGQKGYRDNGTAYDDQDAPFYIFKNISFLMKGQSAVHVTFALESIDVTLGTRYLYTFDQTLANVFNLSSQQISALTNETRLNYYVTSTAYAENNRALPTGANPSSIYMVYNTETSKVTHIIITSSVVSQYLTFDYWKSNDTDKDDDGTPEGIEPGDSHTSALSSGIDLTYGTEVSVAGIVNYVGVYVGFYGYDSTNSRYTECIFSDNNFQGSSFKLLFSAGGV